MKGCFTDIWSLILPYAFDTPMDYLNLILTCKHFLDFSRKHRDIFWRPYLQDLMDTFVNDSGYGPMIGTYRVHRDRVIDFMLSPQMHFLPCDFLLPTDRRRILGFDQDCDLCQIMIRNKVKGVPFSMMTICGVAIVVADYFRKNILDDRKISIFYGNGDIVTLDTAVILDGALMGGFGKYVDLHSTRIGTLTTSSFLLDGNGTIVYNNGMVITGNFDMGFLNGTGKITWPDNSYFIGNFINGKRIGIGHLTDGDDTVMQDWGTVDDNYDGKCINGQHVDNPTVYPKKHTYRTTLLKRTKFDYK